MTSNTSKIRLLLVDDEYAHLDSMHRELERRGFWVHQAYNGRTALRLLASREFDVVVLDIKLAGIDGTDGIDVLGHIRSVLPDLPVVLLFTHRTYRQAFETTREGVFAYLSKPCDTERLVQIAHRATRSGRRQRAPHPEPVVQLLLVDSDRDLLRSLDAALTDRGIGVTTAGSGVDAYRLLDLRRFDVALIDSEFPDMDGLELLRTIKRDQPATEVYFLTGHPSMVLAIAAGRAGARDVLVKPQDPDYLASCIRSARRREHEAPLQHAG